MIFPWFSHDLTTQIPLFSGEIRWKNPQGPPRYLYDELSQALDLTDQQTLLQVMEGSFFGLPGTLMLLNDSQTLYEV